MKQNGVLQTNAKKRGIMFDPRTKLFLLLTMSAFVLGGDVGNNHDVAVSLFCVMTLLLYCLPKR